MGIFSNKSAPPAAPTAGSFTGSGLAPMDFTIPYDAHTALSILLSGEEWQPVVDNGVVDERPVMETIYLTSLDEQGWVAEAGNRATTYWRYRVELRLDGAGTSGHLQVEVVGDGGAFSPGGSPKWTGNLMKFTFELEARVRSCGGTVLGGP